MLCTKSRAETLFTDKSTDEFRTGHVGQSTDLYWTFDSMIPTEKEYLQMVDASEFTKPQLFFHGRWC